MRPPSRLKNPQISIILAIGLLAGQFVPTLVSAGEPDRFKQSVPDAEDLWKFKMSSPGWLASISGNVGINNHSSHVYVGTDTVIKDLDMTASFSAEARKGRFGVYGDFLYSSDSDGIGRNGLLSKVDLRADEYLADLEINYRLIQGPRGWVDLRAGLRYLNLYDREVLHPNNGEIEKASARFVDETGKLVAGELRRLLKGEESVLPIPPLLELEKERILRLILAAKKDPELAAAIKSGVRSRIDDAKARVQNRIAGILSAKLNQTLSLAENWLDPYVGLACRYDLGKSFYLTSKLDIGGFGAGSKFTWQGYGALGCQLTRYVFAEAGYRYFYVDYQRNGFLFDVSQQGAQITLGLSF